jgi:hypothetical protein
MSKKIFKKKVAFDLKNSRLKDLLILSS